MPKLSSTNPYMGQYNEKTMKRTIEIRAAEGGEDAKLFTKDLATAYIKHFTRVG